jgi:hypothetical protein
MYLKYRNISSILGLKEQEVRKFIDVDKSFADGSNSAS